MHQGYIHQLADANMRSKTIGLIKFLNRRVRASLDIAIHTNSEAKFNEFEVVQLFDKEAEVTMLRLGNSIFGVIFSKD